MKKRLFILVLACALACAALTGCRKKDDGNTLTLNLSSRNMDAFLDALEAKFPEIHFEIYQYCGSDSSDFLHETLVHNDASDLVFNSQQVSVAGSVESLLDLSSYGFINQRIDSGMLHQYAVDGRIYQVPGPVSQRSIAYNKTIFDEHGWNIPNNFGELVDLVRQIRAEEPELIPIAMSLGGVGYDFTCVTTFAQTGFLSTPAGAAWEKRYLVGEASVAEGWSDGLDMMAELIDAGAFLHAEDFVGVWDNRVMRDCFAQGKAAMMFVWAGQQTMAGLIDAGNYEFVLAPFCGRAKDQDVLVLNCSVNWGLSRRLGEKGNEKKLQNALRVLDWLNTAEAQMLLANNAAEVPSLKEADMDGLSEAYWNLWSSTVPGDKAIMIYSGFEDVIVEAGNVIRNHLLAGSSEGMKEEFIAVMDERHAQTLASGEKAYGVLKDDLSAEQAVQLVANMMDAAQLGDFAMVTKGGNQGRARNPYGVNGWLYAGKIDSTNYSVLSSSRSTVPVDVVSLTGAKVRELLENGRVDAQNVSWPYYWSGLDVTFKKGKISSVRLNGAELENDKTYRVVFMNGDYNPAWAAEDGIEATSASPLDIFKEYLAKYSPVPAPEVLRKDR